MPAAGLTAFRVFYSGVYGFLCLLLALLLCVSPADFIRQAVLVNHQLVNVLIVAIVYLLTVLIVLFVYSFRLYTTRTVVAGIPKDRIPVEKGDVTPDVRRMIAAGLGRSAAIAWSARPHAAVAAAAADAPPPGPASHDSTVPAAAPGGPPVENSHSPDSSYYPSREEKRARPSWPSPRRPSRRAAPRRAEAEHTGVFALPPVCPVWGEIEHAGWGAPDAPSAAGLQYSTVLAELPHLIEAKAVGQAGGVAVPDGAATDLLQRTAHMGMRQYVEHLAGLGVLAWLPATEAFVGAYEDARFSGRPLGHAAFRELMHRFAELLRGVRPLDAASVPDAADADSRESDSHIDDDAPRDTAPTTPAARSPSEKGQGDRRSVDGGEKGGPSADGRRPPTLFGDDIHPDQSEPPRRPAGASSADGRRPPQQHRAFPMMSRGTAVHGQGHTGTAGAEFADAFAQSRMPYPASSAASSSSRLTSASRSSGGSVIRLPRPEDAGR